MPRHGDLFPGNPRTLDELLEQMARRMAAMSGSMASLTADQRDELQASVRAGDAGDMDLAFEVDRLGANFGARSRDAVGEPAFGEGDEAMPMPRRSTRLNAARVRGARAGPRRGVRGRVPRRRRREAVRRTLGESAAQDLPPEAGSRTGSRQAGLVQRRTGGSRSPRAARGRSASARLTQVFEQLKRDREGPTRRATVAVWPSRRAPTRPAIRRPRADRGPADGLQRGHESRGPEPRVASIDPDDFELVEAENADRDRDGAAAGPVVPRCRCADTSSTRRRWRSRCTR